MTEAFSGQDGQGKEQSAEVTRNWQEAVVQSLQEAVIGTTTDGLIVSWNEGAGRLFGYGAAEMIGRSAAVLQPPGPQAATSWTSIGPGEHLQSRLIWVRKDGSPIALIANSSPIRESSGEVVGTAVVAPMSGRVLAERIRELQPDLAVLYLSGYSEGVIGPQRIVPEGAHLLEKPFTAATLLRQVQAALIRSSR